MGKAKKSKTGGSVEKLMLTMMVCMGMVAAGNAAEEESKKDIKTFPAEGITAISIRTNSALIYIESAQAIGIRVEQLPDNVRACNVTMKAVGSQFILKAMDKTGEYKDIKTGFRVQLPPGISVTAGSNSGKIEIHNATGSVEAKTNSGDIALDNVSGSLKAATNSGDIKGTFKSLETSKKIALKTTSGDVSATFPENAIIAVNARTNSGRIHNDFTGKVGCPLTVKTTSGNISITKAEKQP